jgi:hypothetical protein
MLGSDAGPAPIAKTFGFITMPPEGTRPVIREQCPRRQRGAAEIAIANHAGHATPPPTQKGKKKKKKKKKKEAKRKDGRWEQGTQGVLATRNPRSS